MAAETDKPAAVFTYNEAHVNQLVKVGLAATGSFSVDWGDGVLKKYDKTQFCIDSVRGKQVRLYGDFVHRLYYNLNGQQLNAEPTHGLYFIKEMRSNGTSTVRKVTK